MSENGDRRAETEARIQLARRRFLGMEAAEAKTALVRFLEHCYAYDVSVPRESFRAALEVRKYLDDFARDALF